MPRKNLVELMGRPLLAYTCAAARGSARLDRTIVSTDDAAIAEVARREGIDVPFLRPAAIAADETPMIDVVRHALEALAVGGYVPDAVAILQPTSPLRRTVHVDAAIERLEAGGADTVVTVMPVPHQFTPESLMRLEGARLVPCATASAPLRRQDKPVLFARNGPAVLVVRRHVVETGSFYGGVVHAVPMEPDESIDIDSEEDLALAAFYLARRGGRP